MAVREERRAVRVRVRGRARLVARDAPVDVELEEPAGGAVEDEEARAVHRREVRGLAQAGEPARRAGPPRRRSPTSPSGTPVPGIAIVNGASARALRGPRAIARARKPAALATPDLRGLIRRASRRGTPVILRREAPEVLGLVEAVDPLAAHLHDLEEHAGRVGRDADARRVVAAKAHGDAAELEVVLERDVEELDVAREAVHGEEREKKVRDVAAEALEAALRVEEAARHEEPHERRERAARRGARPGPALGLGGGVQRAVADDDVEAASVHELLDVGEAPRGRTGRRRP